MESRNVRRSPQAREADGGKRITGYAAVFYRADNPDTEYELWPGVFERIMPGAFDKIADDDVRALRNHDPNLLLGRTKSKSLTLSVDDVGLVFDIAPKDTATYRDTVTDLESGDLDGSSFSFVVRGENWKKEDGKEIRMITDAQVFDVGPVTFPAYTGTSADARCMEARDSRDKWLKSSDHTKEIMRREYNFRKLQTY